ncbi:SgcJ/EcaC family oxidoreductase [Pseudomonas eucalypticola]|uniref:SgcJ/EcaC family oxidoreductase n=1 Tax=Pseudomonas eucalypticola TaxID=2599595 RepID=A0A7D5D8K6_9PSED|nr:SgcJ/EcaC family oxidoreductase [Pseudomonas eucalypticola]QKZ05593.1 SgcJ/EcaC family oxidoreductase [Pseudomonas eucalypticola]
MKGITLLALLALPFAAHATPQCPAKPDVASLFDRWNAALLTGEPAQVAATYGADAVLLPTLSNRVRMTHDERLDYFQHFLANKPSGRIVSRTSQAACDSALDAGIYEFTFATTGETVQARYSFNYRWDGQQWLIASHHSSLMPEAAH